MSNSIEIVYAAIYVRVSSLAQESEGTSLATQTAVLLQLAEREGYTVSQKHIFSDTIPGESTLRPGFQQLLGAIEAREVSVVLILDPDRLGRGSFEVLSLCMRISEAGAVVHFLNGPSSGSEGSELLMMITGWAAGQERMKIAERTMRGKRAVARSGRMPIGVGGAGMYGYDYDKVTQNRTINEAEAAVLRMAYEWCDGGWSTYRIGCELNDRGILTKRGCRWHYRTIKNMLRHTSYKGWDVYGKYRCRLVYVNKGTPDEKRKIERTLRPESEWIWIQGYSDVIIEPEVWERVQRRLDESTPRRQADPYLLTGFVRCALCGTRINGASRYAGRRRYRCRGTAATMTRPKICSSGYLDAEDLEHQVMGGLANALRNPGVVMAEIEQFLNTGQGDLTQLMADLQRKVRDCRSRESRFLTLFGDAVIDEDSLRSQIAPLQELRRECEVQLDELERQRQLAQSAGRVRDQVLETCNDLAHGIDRLDYDGRRRMLGVLDVKAVAQPGEVSMTMTLSGKCTTIARTLA